MPWKSVKQARWGHSEAGREALGNDAVEEFDDATSKGSLKGTKGSKRKLRKGEFRKGGYDWRDYD